MTFWNHTLAELFDKGGFCMWPILACSILGLAVILDRSWTLARTYSSLRILAYRLEGLLRMGNFEEARALVCRSSRPLHRLTTVYLDHLDAPASLRTSILEREASEQIARLDVRMNWLATVASVSTLLGLLGTVTGLVTAFHQIELSGGTVQPSDLASGIWEALITTVFGLVVAIPALAAYHLLDHQAGRMALKMEWLISYLDEWTQSSDQKSAHGGERA